MPLSGTYGQLVSFLDKIQRSPRFVTVDEVRLSRAEAGQRPEMEVSFSAFFRPEGGAS
jgi:Tfp pilus assembly protein PilO